MRKKITMLPIFALMLLLVSSVPAAGAVSGAPAAAPPDYAFIDSFIGHGQTYPLSCESRSASDLAAYWGISVPEVTFFDNLPTSDNPEVGFVGSVFGSWGQTPPNPYGVHAKPVARLLRQYGLEARARRGMTIADLKTEIAAGRPVIVWVIGRVWSGSSYEYKAQDGSTVIVAPYEHTMIVYGYDQSNIYLVDAGSGARQGHSIQNFRTSWAVLGNMAVTTVGSGGEQPVDSGNQNKPGTYVVQPGDYLTKLAKQWGISWQDLAALNGITYPYTIYAGQVLVTGQQEEAPSPTATPKPTKAPEKTPKPTANPTKTPKPTEPPSNQNTTSYTVQAGDHLMKIASQLNLDWTQIAALNNLTWPYILYPGQNLILPGGAGGSASVQHTPEPTVKPQESQETYTVQRGEHLMQIARKLELSWTAIAQMNNLWPPYTLHPGQVLTLPGPEAGPPPPPLEQGESGISTSGEEYVVQPGDYLYTLAQKFGVSWQTLAANNNISYPYIVYAGQVLKIP